ncbi:MAG TPA: hypothetical protein VL793_12310, partial [Patescibacteria group bacterium]|nr:hypothetical protein [Patescibacteria group bacterium]
MDAVTQWCKLSEDDEERTGFRASGSEPGLKYCAPKTNGSCFRDRVRSASAKNGATIGTQRDLSIERRIQVTFRHRIFFTREAFSTSNLLLRKVVGAGKREDAKRVLIVLDAALAGT